MELYKILHKPTGLYYKPNRGNGNFSKSGKVYTMKPQLRWLEHKMKIRLYTYSGKFNKFQQTLLNYFKIEIPENPFIVEQYVFVPIEDWEIIRIN